MSANPFKSSGLTLVELTITLGVTGVVALISATLLVQIRKNEVLLEQYHRRLGGTLLALRSLKHDLRTATSVHLYPESQPSAGDPERLSMTQNYLKSDQTLGLAQVVYSRLICNTPEPSTHCLQRSETRDGLTTTSEWGPIEILQWCVDGVGASPPPADLVVCSNSLSPPIGLDFTLLPSAANKKRFFFRWRWNGLFPAGSREAVQVVDIETLTMDGLSTRDLKIISR